MEGQHDSEFLKSQGQTKFVISVEDNYEVKQSDEDQPQFVGLADTGGKHEIKKRFNPYPKKTKWLEDKNFTVTLPTIFA
jgi:hypothetical protein